MTKVIIVGYGNDIPESILKLMTEKGIDPVIISEEESKKSLSQIIEEDNAFKITNIAVPYKESFTEQAPNPIYIPRRKKFKRK